MTLHIVLIRLILAAVMLFCWLGVLGMWRMREPTQALQYFSLPACGATIFLTIAVFLQTGNGQAGWKTLLICLIVLAFNSVVTHATARSFRARALGHWQARPGDLVEFVRDTRQQ